MKIALLILPTILFSAAMAAPTPRILLNSVAETPIASFEKTTPDSLVLTTTARTFVFADGLRQAHLDGISIYMNAPATLDNGVWSIHSTDSSLIICPAIAPALLNLPAQPGPVILDPGHGGSDSGATSPIAGLEKNLTMDIARHTHAYLTRAGIASRLTRTDDTDLPLNKRHWRQPASLFISIHANSAINPHASGIETFTLPAPGFVSTSGSNHSTAPYPGNRFDLGSSVLAIDIHSLLLHDLPFEDRGIRRARFEVLKRASCPAVLVECGFLSNSDDASRLAQPATRQAIARALSKGILLYLSRITQEHSDSSTIAVTPPLERENINDKEPRDP